MAVLGPVEPALLPRIVPDATPETEPYWRALKQREVRMQRCSACGYLRHPARWICPECLSEQYAWERLSGCGTVHSFIWYMQPFDPSFTAVPYNVAVVQLDEGPRVITNVEQVLFGELAVGQRVRAQFVDVSDEWAVLRFRLEEAEARGARPAPDHGGRFSC